MQQLLTTFTLLFLFSFTFAQSEQLNEAKKHFAENQFQDVINLLEPILEEGIKDHQANLLLGRSYLGLKDHDKAIQQLKKSRKALEQDSHYHFYVGHAYLGKLNNTSNFFEKGIVASKVKEAFEKAVKLNPENLDARQSLVRYYLTAPTIAGGSKSKAKEQIDFIKSRNPQLGYYEMANYYWSDKKYEQAIDEYKAFLPLAEGKKASVHYQIGFSYQIIKAYDSAFSHFEKAIIEDPAYLNAHYQYARTAIFAKKNIEQALKKIQYYIQENGLPNGPDLASAHWRLGMLYELMDDGAKAKQTYLKALEINPEHKQSLEALEGLK